METAYRAGMDAVASHLKTDPEFLRGLEVPEDLWVFDPRPRKEGATSRGEKKPTPKWVDDPELANLPFNPELCNCRKWNGGYGAQCNRAPLDGEELCALHQKNYERVIDQGGEDLSHGRFNLPRPTHCLAKPDKEQEHAWKDLKEKKAAKRASDKAEKAKKAEEDKAAKEEAKAAKKAEKEKIKAEK